MKKNIIESFSFEDKFKIWMHYVAHVSFQNHNLLELDVNNFTESHFGKNYREFIKYPVLLPNKMFIEIKTKFKTRSFYEFISDNDARNSSGILGYYFRFQKEIKL
jgi:hypothetical protein